MPGKKIRLEIWVHHTEIHDYIPRKLSGISTKCHGNCAEYGVLKYYYTILKPAITYRENKQGLSHNVTESPQNSFFLKSAYT